MPYRIIDPGEDLDYTCDWGEFLDDGGSPSDTISQSSWSIDPDPGGSPAPQLHDSSYTVSTTTIWVSGAELGMIYLLTNTIVTTEGRTAQRSLTLRCEQR